MNASLDGPEFPEFEGFGSKRMRWIEQEPNNIHDANDYLSLHSRSCTGYYCDDECDTVAVPAVYVVKTPNDPAKREGFLLDLTRLVAHIKIYIEDDCRATDDPSDETPAIAITVGADNKGWSWQTGDNSFTGGAYGYAYWGCGSVARDDDPAKVAEAILDDLEFQAIQPGAFFYEARPEYYAAVRDPYNPGCAVVDFEESYDDPEEAARAAHGLAERYADSEREYQAKESARIEAQEVLPEELRYVRRAHMRAIKIDDAVGARMRAEYREVAADLIKKIRELNDQYNGFKE